MVKRIKTILAQPFEDFLSGLESCLSEYSIHNIFVLILCFVISWWIYVPLHELGHAFGCILGGGTVSKLEISPIYGASLLKEIFHFVSVGSEYSGQLTGFDTKGSDLIYLLTDFFPFLLTIFIGIPLLRSVRGSKPLSAAIKLGLGLPIAFASFISITGDYYEMGSIIVSKGSNVISPVLEIGRWRSDDLFKLASEIFLSETPHSAIDIIGVSLSFLLGIVFIYVTYVLGVWWSQVILWFNTKPS